MIAGVSELWAETTGDPRVVVAVLDGPVDRVHPSLAGAALLVVEVVASSSPIPGGPATGHGTAVAGLIFGRHGADRPAWGMAPGCRGLIVPIFEDAGAAPGTGDPPRPSCSQLDLARAILTAVEAGASIINISAGQYGPASSAERVLAAAVDRAIRRGVLVVAAAGNGGREGTQVPAALPGVLAVGATDGDDRPADLLAPGDESSFAAAVVSGAAALLWSLALRRGQVPGAERLREILLDSARKCFDHSMTGRRHPAGRLDLPRALRLLRYEGVRMSDEFPLPHPADEPSRPVGTGTASPRGPGRPGPSPAAPGPIVASSGCGCAACQGAAAPATATDGGLVFALGQVGFDLISEARRDSIAQHMGGPAANPWEPARMLEYLEEHPWEAASVAWTLNADQTPIYAIAPAGPFAGRAYEWLREFLGDQVRGEVELVSIAGRLAGRARLYNGRVVPAIVPELRGMSSWSTGALVRAVVGDPPSGRAPAAARDAFARKEAGVRGFLEKVYHELRNLGVAAEERAINFAATNAFQVGKVFESAQHEAMELDTIEAERSAVGRPDSDCWDVKVAFFYPERPEQAVRKVYRFTVDVSDIVPVTVGPLRSWFAR